MQLASYMLALGLPNGILWNVRNNKIYGVKILDRENLLDKIINTITKGVIKNYIACNI